MNKKHWLYILIFLLLIIIFELGIIFLQLSKNYDDFLTAIFNLLKSNLFSAIIGGSLTLVGVLISINSSKEQSEIKRKEDEIKENLGKLKYLKNYFEKLQIENLTFINNCTLPNFLGFRLDNFTMLTDKQLNLFTNLKLDKKDKILFSEINQFEQIYKIDTENIYILDCLCASKNIIEKIKLQIDSFRDERIQLSSKYKDELKNLNSSFHTLYKIKENPYNLNDPNEFETKLNDFKNNFFYITNFIDIYLAEMSFIEYQKLYFYLTEIISSQIQIITYSQNIIVTLDEKIKKLENN